MAPTYFQLEEALQNAALQVETMSAIIGALIYDHTNGKRTFTAEQLRISHESFNVIVTPDKDSITITLKEKTE